jgi:hypothetical protein
LLRDQSGGCDHREVLLSLVYRLVRGLFGLLTVLVRADLSKDVELLVLRHENQVLRRQLGGRPRWDHADRLWLAALSRLIRRRQWAEVFPVTPRAGDRHDPGRSGPRPTQGAVGDRVQRGAAGRGGGHRLGRFGPYAL